MISIVMNAQTNNRWSSEYDCCVTCKTKARKHKARGLCYKCYDSQKEFEHRGVRKKKGDATAMLTRDFLIARYVSDQNSLSEIAKECGCTRQLVYIRMKDNGIPLRSKKEARSIALSEKKIAFHRKRDDGTEENVILNVQKVDDTFFKKWSPAMAYVLGVIYTDGNIIAGRLRNPSSGYSNTCSRLTISQKEPELLNKVLNLMNCQTTLLKSNRKSYGGRISGEKYYFHINNETIYEDLLKLGVVPNKSKVITFPDIPELYIRHFIRGCWDGDGSVYISAGKLQASFVSGSKEFIERINTELFLLGIVKVNKEIKYGSLFKVPLAVYKSKTSKSYSIRLRTIENMELFYKYLYDGVDESLYLTRKHDVFVNGLGVSTKHF